ncbi:MAG: phytanoyl-CoA dioxygenase family protein [Alphaproteobacteria bacterium]
MLDRRRLADFQRDGFLILETFVSHKDCDGLLERTAELVAKFEPQEQKPVFSTTEKEQTSDQYFLGSGDKIRFFRARRVRRRRRPTPEQSALSQQNRPCPARSRPGVRCLLASAPTS